MSHPDRRDPAELRQREFDRNARSKLRRRVLPFTAKVVGVSFTPTYPENLYALDASAQAAEVSGEPLAIVLRRNPDNKHDSNAIEVHVPALGEMGFIGHLPGPLVARLAPQIDDEDGEWGGYVASVLVDPAFPDRPGISVHCQPVPQEENA